MNPLPCQKCEDQGSIMGIPVTCGCITEPGEGYWIKREYDTYETIRKDTAGKECREVVRVVSSTYSKIKTFKKIL